MALIKCSECGHEVSDKAQHCPNCGCPIEQKLTCGECGAELSADDVICPNCGNPIRTKKKNRMTKATMMLVLLAIVMVGGAFAFWKYSSSPTCETSTSKINIFTKDGELSEEQMQEEQEKLERQAERIREEQARQQYMEREQQKSQQRENARASQNNSNDDNSIYSTDEGRQSYMEVL